MIICYTDNVDTRSSLDAMRELVAASYTYVERRRQAGAAPNRVLLKNAAVYVTDILKVSVTYSRSVWHTQGLSDMHKVTDILSVTYSRSVWHTRGQSDTLCRDWLHHDMCQLIASLVSTPPLFLSYASINSPLLSQY